MRVARSSPSNETPAHLVYVDAGMPGIERCRKGKGFAYRAPDGHWLARHRPEDRAHLQRIRQLAIPPAYVGVWICPLPCGHLQAVGHDARGRKQYRYHPQWREAREQDKFGRLHDFGMTLPRLREQVRQDLAAVTPGARPLGRQQVLATLVRLLDTTHLRIGNESYVRENQSYGLTTLRNRHARVEGNHVSLRFRGKSGVWHAVSLTDPRVARVIRRCQNLPGQELFQYEDESGERHAIGSADVNAYIRSACGGDFTAKDFRTWHATVHAWALLAPPAQGEPPELAQSGAPRPASRIVEALKQVAHRLGNTVAVCRKSYVHPLVLRSAAQAAWPAVTPRLLQRYRLDGLDEREQGLLCFLEAAQRAEPGCAQPL